MLRIGFNFRKTVGAATEQVGEYFVDSGNLSPTYPQRYGGWTAGLVRTYYSDGRDRAGTRERRIKGLWYSDGVTEDAGFRLDLPAGRYRIHLLQHDSEYGIAGATNWVMGGLAWNVGGWQFKGPIYAHGSFKPSTTTSVGRADGCVFPYTDMEREAYGGGILVTHVGGSLYVGSARDRLQPYLILSHMLVEQVGPIVPWTRMISMAIPFVPLFYRRR